MNKSYRYRGVQVQQRVDFSQQYCLTTKAWLHANTRTRLYETLLGVLRMTKLSEGAN